MRTQREHGFSIVELLFVVAIAAIMAVIAIPNVFKTQEDMRLKGDGRAIAQMVGLAKMRAAAKFSRARLFVDFGAGNFFLQYFDKTTATCCWITEGAQTLLSPGVSFGFGILAAPPPNTQPAIQQSPACTDGAGTAIANTACIVFNSRGIPINPLNGAALGGNAIYLTDGVGVFATTVTATPLVRLWWSPAQTANWTLQ
jgi:prepilin-type N-terminal cleavage/methylation domain-containing protein